MYFDNTLHATETALRSDPNAYDWAETEKRFRAEYEIGDEHELNQPKYFAAGTPAWPEEWVFRQVVWPLQTLRDRGNVAGINAIARSEPERQIMLGWAATLHAYARAIEERSIPKNWPRNTDQDLLDFTGASRLAKAENFLWELHQCMVFAFRDIMKRDSQHRVIGVKNEIQEWSHPKLFVAVVQGLEQLQSKIFYRLHHDSLQSVLNQFLYRLEDEVKAWQSSFDESSAKHSSIAQSDTEGPINGAPSHSPDFTSVNWYGQEYHFAKGNQAESVRALWDAWEQGNHTLSQETIADEIKSSATRFELRKTFRQRKAGGGGLEQHPAWGTMIQKSGKGCFRLAKP